MTEVLDLQVITDDNQDSVVAPHTDGSSVSFTC